MHQLAFNPLKSIKKAAGKVDKVVDRATKNINRATLGKKYGDMLTRAQQSEEGKKVKKAAAMAVAAYFGGPVAAKAVGSAFASMGATNMGAAIAAKGAAMGTGSLTAKIATSIAKEGVTHLASKELKRRAVKKQNELERTQLDQAKHDIFGALNITAADIEALSKDKAFSDSFDRMIREGKSLDEIEKAWANSETFRDIVMRNVPNIISPIIEHDLVKEGIPPGHAKQIAKDVAIVDTNDAIDNLKTETALHKYGPMIAIATPFLFAAIAG